MGYSVHGVPAYLPIQVPVHSILLLGCIQGVSEILPISSSVNLVLLTALFGIQDFSFSLKIALHAGSLVAFIVYFRSEIKNIFKSFFSKSIKISQTYFWSLVFGTIPVVILGVLARDFVVEFDSRKVMGISSVLFGILLWIADRISANSCNKRPVSVIKSFIIGCFQAISIFPGVSRLGITITASRILSIDRKKSIFFAMFIAIPSICGSLILEILDLFNRNDFSILQKDTLYGVGITAIVGILSIYPCVRIMERCGFLWIAIYRIVIGCVIAFL
jgi:undecaprenyl-diphosphatase